MKHVGTDNFLLYALCQAAVRLENAARASVAAVKRLAAYSNPLVSGPRPVDVKSAGTDQRLGKGQQSSTQQ